MVWDPKKMFETNQICVFSQKESLLGHAISANLIRFTAIGRMLAFRLARPMRFAGTKTVGQLQKTRCHHFFSWFGLSACRATSWDRPLGCRLFGHGFGRRRFLYTMMYRCRGSSQRANGFACGATRLTAQQAATAKPSEHRIEARPEEGEA